MRTNFLSCAAGTAIIITLALSSAWAETLSSDSQMGEILDNPSAKSVLDKHVPGLADNLQMGQARGMSLRSLQMFVPALTNEVLEKIDKDLEASSQDN